jgi:dihydroorotase
VALLLKGGHLVDPSAGRDGVADVLIGDDGTIATIGEDLKAPKGADVVDCTGKVVLPGLVDIHTHVREPGREDEETVASATRAAAHGGYTAICAMPNTAPVADEGASVASLMRIVERDAVVRVHPIGAITVGQKGEALAEMGDMVAAGAVAFSDDGHGVQDAGLMRRAMDYSKLFDVALVSHCEVESLAGKGVVHEGAVSTRLGLPGIPAAAEEVMVARDIALAELTGARLHLAHLSTAGSVELVRAAKARGVKVTAEVTPHHLFLTEDDITSYDTNRKMNPPLRTKADAEALLAGLHDGTVDAIATDHAPHAPQEKELEFELAPFGTTGLETALALVVTHLVEPGKASWADVATWMSVGPRACVPMLPGVSLAEGSVADITIVDPEARVTVTPEWFESRSANSAFTGDRLLGKASEVLVGGHLALRHGKVVAQ